MNKKRKRQDLLYKAGVYKITCLSNDRFYIGSSENLYQRLLSHKSDLRNNKHGNKEFQSDYNTYGIDNFKFEVIEFCTKENHFDREQVYLDMYNGNELFYNRCVDAISGMKGRQHTDEAKKKIGKANTGKHLSDETKNKIKEAKKGKHNQNSKMVYIYDKNCNLIYSIHGISECARFLLDKSIIISESKNPTNIIQSNINRAMRNNQPYNNLVFSYNKLSHEEIINIYNNIQTQHHNGIYMYKDNKEYYFETLKDCCEFLLDNKIVITKSKDQIKTISGCIRYSIKQNKLYKGFIFSYEKILL